MLQNPSQVSGKETARQGQGGGAKTVAGRQRQIAARISNGVHFQSPVLPNGIESQADWDAHLARLKEALQPVGSWEELCVYRIALSEASLEEEMFQQRDFMLRVNALAGEDVFYLAAVVLALA